MSNRTPSGGCGFEARLLYVGGGVQEIEDGSAMAVIMANDPGYQTAAEEFGRPKPNFLAEELEAGARQLAAARAEAEKAKNG